MAETKHRVRAVIIESGKLLLIYRVKNGRHYWVFPGGGVEASDESFEHAVRRECSEELNLGVEVLGSPAFTLTSEFDGRTVEESFYNCRITSGELGYGHGAEFTRPDRGTYAFVWVPLTQINAIPLFPEEAAAHLVLK